MFALEGVKVLDLTRQGPGPFCTMILGDLGAEVIKIEAPPALGARKGGLLQSPAGAEGKRDAIYNAHNRNKKSIAVNLRVEEGRRIFCRLTENADVIVEAFRPGVVNRLGIDYEAMKSINPKVIYCSITAYGQDGPYKGLPAHDVNCISIAGALNLMGDMNGKPVIPLNLLADFGGGGMSAVIGILSALIAREKTGEGQHIDISLTDSVISLLTFEAGDYFQHGVVLKRGEHVLGGAYPYYNVYETSDQKYITIGCMEPWLWENLCRAIGREDFIPFHLESDHRLHKPEDKKWDEISSFLRQIFLTKTRDEWFELLSQKDIPVGKVYSMDEALSDPQVLHRKMVIEVEDPTEGKVKQVGIAIKLSETPGAVRRLSPILGEHTAEILTALGYSKQKINGLFQDGVISYP
jgi:crotonobetainyl-CoA:carnitine CoA-transferase CaiB-like acyl-CoA transferase